METFIVTLHSMFHLCQAIAPAPHGKIMSTLFHAHAFYEVVNKTTISFIAHRILKIPGANAFLPSVKVSSMDLCSEFYDVQHRLHM